MIPPEISFKNIRVQLLSKGDRFLGLGAIWINNTQVRSAELPLAPFAENMYGLRFEEMRFLGSEESAGGVIIHAEFIAKDNDWEIRLDHSLDRIINTNSWNRTARASARLDFILKPSSVSVDGRKFEGFSYAFQYKGDQAIHLLVDRSTWEIGGRITGNTYYGQINFGSPTITYALDTDDSSEGVIGFPLNPQMTQAMPRWAGGPTVDYLFKGNDALVLCYDKVNLIRSVMKKSPGEDFLKFLEQHYFDVDSNQTTSARHVLLDSSSKTDIDHKNLWTHWHDHTNNAARAEFGMHETEYPTILGHNFWNDFTFESYAENLIPCARALSYGAIFVDPVWQNDMTKEKDGSYKNTGGRYGNMCCPWEFDVAPALGGEAGLSKMVASAHEGDVKVLSWIGTHVSDLYFPDFKKLKDLDWRLVTLADGRHAYGSGYDSIHGMDLNTSYAKYVSDRVGHVHKATGLDGCLYDSFYNFGFMPVTYNRREKVGDQTEEKLLPRTQFRACIEMMKRFQQAGCHMMIESFGPFGHVQHGCTSKYNEDVNEFVRYKGNLSPGYSTIPVGQEKMQVSNDAKKHFRLVSGKSQLGIPMFINKERIDTIADPLLKQTNEAARHIHKDMHARTLLPGNEGALWTSADGKTKTMWTFGALSRKVKSGTKAKDVFTGQPVSAGGDSLHLEPYRVYQWTE